MFVQFKLNLAHSNFNPSVKSRKKIENILAILLKTAFLTVTMKGRQKIMKT